jgi:hypothetical protein
VSKGTFLSFENCVYLAGACKVGKSTLASILIGKKITTEYISTDGLNIYFGRNGIDSPFFNPYNVRQPIK